MTFEYRFERLMKLNETEKQQLERDYQSLFTVLEQIAQKLVELMQKKEMCKKALHDESLTKVSASSIHERLRHLEIVEYQIEREEKNYLSLKDKVESMRQALTEKSIEVKKHEKMKESALIHFRTLEKKIELKAMDEQAQLLRNYRTINSH